MRRAKGQIAPRHAFLFRRNGASGFCVGYLSEIPAGNKSNPPLWKRITVRFSWIAFRIPHRCVLPVPLSRVGWRPASSANKEFDDLVGAVRVPSLVPGQRAHSRKHGAPTRGAPTNRNRPLGNFRRQLGEARTPRVPRFNPARTNCRGNPGGCPIGLESFGQRVSTLLTHSGRD